MLEAFQKSGSIAGNGVDVRALVSRGPRTAREWLSGLDGLVHGGAVRYRVAAIAPELLLEVVHDANGATDTRAGAAAALIRSGDATARPRIRVAADACADPTLRTALLSLSEAEDDEAIERALTPIAR